MHQQGRRANGRGRMWRGSATLTAPTKHVFVGEAIFLRQAGFDTSTTLNYLMQGKIQYFFALKYTAGVFVLAFLIIFCTFKYYLCTLGS